MRSTPCHNCMEHRAAEAKAMWSCSNTILPHTLQGSRPPPSDIHLPTNRGLLCLPSSAGVSLNSSTVKWDLWQFAPAEELQPPMTKELKQWCLLVFTSFLTANNAFLSRMENKCLNMKDMQQHLLWVRENCLSPVLAGCNQSGMQVW